MQKEAKARIKINGLLEQASWRLLDSKDGKANVLPPLEVQKEIVAEIDVLRKAVDEYRSLIIICEQKIKEEITDIWRN